MHATLNPNAPLVCPECHQWIPAIRAKSAWCECGWSSAPDEWLSNYPPAKVKKKIEKDRRRAQRLAESDTRLLQSLQNPGQSFIWRFYLYLTLVLSAPVLLPGVAFWIFILVAEILFLSNQIWGVAAMVALIGLGGLAYILLSRSRTTHQNRILKRSSAPLLFEALDEVAAHFHTPRVEKVYLNLNANASVVQNLKWQPRPHFETRLNLGLLAVYALNVTQLKSVLAHEMGHLQGQDTLTLFFVNQAIQTLQTWEKSTRVTIQGIARSRSYLGLFIFVGAFLANGLVRGYLALLLATHFRSMRRQEYLADRGAALAFSRSSLLQALITMTAVDLKFQQSLSIMIERFDNNLDRRDFYDQFVVLWGKMSGEIKSTYYTRAVASFRSVYDTHPSYKDRWKALQHVGSDSLFEDPRSSVELLPNAAEEGRQLTFQLLDRRLNRRS